MLLQVASVCISFVLVGLAYLFPFDSCYAYGVILMCKMKFNFYGFIYWIDDLIHSKHSKLDLPLKPGKTAIITGGSRGIGAAVVKKLLQCDMNVVIACRTISVGENLILQIRKSGVVSGRAKVYKLDNSSLNSVKEFAKKIKEDYDKIHILINNAGIMVPPIYKETEDGFEQQWAINYLSHFLLTSLLLPLLKAGGQPGDCSRIINVTSCAAYMADINFDCINNYRKGIYFTIMAYAQSKLAQMMFAITLQQRLEDRSLNVKTFSVHPGVVNTDLFKNTFIGTKTSILILTKTPEEGAIPVVYTALDKNLETEGGIYLSNCQKRPIAVQALKKATREQLFELSLKQVKLNDFFQYL